jgi:SAM-dependent methyltransferase
MKSLNLYQDKFKKFGVDPKSLLWKSRGAAHQRFRQLWAEIDFNDKSVLDIGCGFGEFGKFLLTRYKNVDYTGIDIMAEFIENAKKEVPGGHFFVSDFLKDKIAGQYGVVIASGVLNSNKGSQNLEYREKAIKKMFSLTSDILAFNMLGGHPTPGNKKNSNVWYSDSLEILEYCMSLTRRIILRANYHPKDFTIIMYKVKRDT